MFATAYKDLLPQRLVVAIPVVNQPLAHPLPIPKRLNFPTSNANTAPKVTAT